MIVDSSALIAIAKQETGWEAIAKVIDSASSLSISAASFLETSIVIDGLRNPVVSSRFDALLRDAEFVIEPVSVEQAKLARQAYRDFGKGSGHRAGLNFGDCFSYALAKEKREPILFKGDDFLYTDLRSAV